MSAEKNQPPADRTPEPIRRPEVIIATASSRIAAQVVQGNLEKGKPISVPNVSPEEEDKLKEAQ